MSPAAADLATSSARAARGLIKLAAVAAEERKGKKEDQTPILEQTRLACSALLIIRA
jgi:hypothetical protein